ncbi:hypothetical protein [Peribacillus aracenensis]|uniref:hypothetical protein n=1 Tax=Peribacillus aracenensis TaxID=2976708 RepID=UPI0021A96601|nr:hypothetical protein [Peribacillus sp. BBB004]
MRIKEDLIVTSISLGGYEVPVPIGLSELLNRAGAWKYIAPGSLDNQMDPLENYEREVVKENGNFRTYLTYKKPLENKKVS